MMSAFKSQKVIETTLTDFTNVASDVKAHFIKHGYAVEVSETAGGYFISLTKGGLFKAVLGMKTALNIDIKTTVDAVTVQAQVGIFGQQIVPSLIVWFVAWPVLLTQISGMVKQAMLDNEAISVVEKAISKYENSVASSSTVTPSKLFCTVCGTNALLGAKFCVACGTKLEY